MPLSTKTKILAAGGGALALLLIATSSKAATNDQPVNPPNPLPNPLPGPNGRKTRPDVYPPGSGEGLAVSNPQGGNLIRTGPGTNNPLSTGGAPGGQPKSTAEGDRHIRPGDHFAILRKNISPSDNQGGSWWEVISPSGLQGFTRGVAPPNIKGDADGQQGGQNFTTIREPGAPAAVAGVNAGFANPYRPFGLAYDTIGKPQADARNRGRDAIRRVYGHLMPGARIGAMTALEAPVHMVCAAPAGTHLRNVPNAPSNVLVPPGAVVTVDDVLPGDKRIAHSPNNGGWARIRYGGQPGYVLSEWLRPLQGSPALIGRPNVAPWARYQ